MKMESFKRQTAYKFWIGDIAAALVQNEGKPFVFVVRNKNVNRVNVIGTVIEKYENENKNYIAVTLDDSSGQIRLKVWNEDTKVLSNYSIGSMIMVVGTLALSNSNEVFIRPEIVKNLTNPDWYKLRRLELEKEYGPPEIKADVKRVEEKEAEDLGLGLVKTTEVIEEQIEEEPIEPSLAAREKVLSLIEKQSKNDGIEIATVVKEAGFEGSITEGIIRELLREGEIFQTRQGRVQII